MDGQDEQPRSATTGDPPTVGPIGLSRRQFARNVGASGVAVGLIWAGPKISTIRYAAKAAAGSPPPTSTSTSTSVPEGPLGTISVTNANPCAGDSVQIHASGFVPKTALTIELDSAAHILGTTTTNGDGRINAKIDFAANGPTGAHVLKVVGVRTGGQTLVLSVPVVIKTAAECKTHSEGSTTTVEPNSSTTGPHSSTSTPTVTTKPQQPQNQQGGESLQHGSGGLAFTGANSSELALVGGAAALAGWALYGIASERDEDADDLDGPGSPA